jgi:hypothetical protein
LSATARQGCLRSAYIHLIATPACRISEYVTGTTPRRWPQPKKRFTKRDGSKVAKLAILAGNAVRNADLHRALELIEEIRVIGERAPAAGTNLQVAR